MSARVSGSGVASPPPTLSSATLSRIAVVREAQTLGAIRAGHALVSAGGAHDAAPCLICGDALLTNVSQPCGHSDICVMCILRLRLITGNRRCPLCQADTEHLVALSQEAFLARGGAATAYEEWGIYGDEGGPSLRLDDASGVFFHTSAEPQRARVTALRQYTCGCVRGGGGAGGGSLCASTFTSLELLTKHTSSEHGQHLCELCARHRAVFVMELPRYRPKQLTLHCTQGDLTAGFSGHPLCALGASTELRQRHVERTPPHPPPPPAGKFCDARHYDDAALYTHLHRDHFHCHWCSANQPPGTRQYYNAYADLERHFERAHYLCREPSCRAARYGVFSSALDLQAHNVDVHNAPVSDVLPHVGFRFARRQGMRSARSPRSPRSDGSNETFEDDGGSSADEGGGRIVRLTYTAEDFPSLQLAGGGGDPGAAVFPADATATGGGGPAPAVRLHHVPFNGGLARIVSMGGDTARSADILGNAAAFPALGPGGGGVSATRLRALGTRSGAGGGSMRLNAYTSLGALLVMTGQGHLMDSAAVQEAGETTTFVNGIPVTFADGGGRTSSGAGHMRINPQSSRQERQVLGESEAAPQRAALPPPPAAKGAAGAYAAAAAAPVPRPMTAAAAPPSSPPPQPPIQPVHANAVVGVKNSLGPLGTSFTRFKELSSEYNRGFLPSDEYFDAALAIFREAHQRAPPSQRLQQQQGGYGALLSPMGAFAVHLPSLLAEMPDAALGCAALELHSAWMLSPEGRTTWGEVEAYKALAAAEAQRRAASDAALAAAAAASKTAASSVAANAAAAASSAAATVAVTAAAEKKQAGLSAAVAGPPAPSAPAPHAASAPQGRWASKAAGPAPISAANISMPPLPPPRSAAAPTHMARPPVLAVSPPPQAAAPSPPPRASAGSSDAVSFPELASTGAPAPAPATLNMGDVFSKKLKGGGTLFSTGGTRSLTTVSGARTGRGAAESAVEEEGEGGDDWLSGRIVAPSKAQALRKQHERQEQQGAEDEVAADAPEDNAAPRRAPRKFIAPQDMAPLASLDGPTKAEQRKARQLEKAASIGTKASSAIAAAPVVPAAASAPPPLTAGALAGIASGWTLQGGGSIPLPTPVTAPTWGAAAPPAAPRVMHVPFPRKLRPETPALRSAASLDAALSGFVTKPTPAPHTDAEGLLVSTGGARVLTSSARCVADGASPVSSMPMRRPLGDDDVVDFAFLGGGHGKKPKGRK